LTTFGQNPLHQFPRSKSVTCWRGQKSAVSVGRVANKSVTSWQLPRLRGSYGETCVMDFGRKWTSTMNSLSDC